MNDGTTVELNRDDIVVFVGPNNSGKSRALKDIFNLLSTPGSGTVVSNVGYEVDEKDRIEADLKDFSILKNSGEYTGAGFTIYTGHVRKFIDQGIVSEGIAKFLTSFLTTEDRLKLVNPPEKIRDGEARQHPIHYIDKERRLIEKIDEAFIRAFNKHLLLNEYDGKYISLSVSNEVMAVENRHLSTRVEYFNEHARLQFAKLPRLENQGDGMKSFAGILLSLFVNHYSVFFIDEPESFLHPPQAYIMGQQLEEMSKGKQVFVATHSEELLKGLIDSSSPRLKIIRITRTDNTNHFAQLDNKDITTIWSDPLLRYSNIMSSLFYDVTVVTESNADCKFYKIIFKALQEEGSKHKDVVFVESGGKQRLKIVCSALRSLNVDFRVTPDFDIFRQEKQVKELYESCGGNWDKDCSNDWKIIDHSLPEGPDELDRETVRKKLNDILDRAEGDSLNKQNIRNLKGVLKGTSKWDGPKYHGLASITDAKAQQAAATILQQFNEKLIFPIHSGEMESLVPEFNDHGKNWVADLLESHPDLSDKIYDTAKDYVKSLGLD